MTPPPPAAAIAAPSATRECRRCGKTKALNLFKPHSMGPQGYAHTCLDCAKTKNPNKVHHPCETPEARRAKRKLTRAVTHPGVKLCVRCHEIKPLEQMKPHHQAKDGYAAVCLACTAPPATASPTKVCPRCKHELPREAFGRNTKRYDGLQTYCRPCFQDKRAESALRVAGISREVAEKPMTFIERAKAAVADNEALMELLLGIEAEKEESIRKLTVAENRAAIAEARVAELEAELEAARTGEKERRPAVMVPGYLEEAFAAGMDLLVSKNYPEPVAAARHILEVVDSKLANDAHVRQVLTRELFEITADPERHRESVIPVESQLNRFDFPLWKANAPLKHRVLYTVEGHRVTFRVVDWRKGCYAGRGRN